MTWYASNEGEAPCPVCGVGTLDNAWLAKTQANLEAAAEGTRQAKIALQALRGSISAAKKLIRATDEPTACKLSHFELARTQYDVRTAGSSDEPFEAFVATQT